MSFWLAFGIALWLGSVVVAIALCKAAARADKQLGYDSDPYEIRLRATRVERALKRAGVQPIETHGRSQLGIDRTHHR